MKKILVVLLVLAVAGGVFAQGSWRVSGNVEIGTRINLDTDPNDPDDVATTAAIGWNSWDAPRGQFQLRYVNEGTTVGLRFNTRGAGPENEPFFTYSGENFNFKTGLHGNELLVAGYGYGSSANANNLKWLWGEYKMLDGLLDLLVAFRSEELEYWESDRTAGSGRMTMLRGGPGSSNPGSAAARGTEEFGGGHHNFFGKPSTFAYIDQNNVLVANMKLDALNFGIMIPYLFMPGELVDGSLKQSVFGVKFNMSPIEFAAQLKAENYGIYFGGRFFAGPMVAGLSFSGLLNPAENVNKFIKIGGDLAYNAGVFGAGLAASLERHTSAADAAIYDQLIRLQPRFFYNAIPSHLCFALDAGFYFYNKTVGDIEDTDMTWVVQPQLFWTFLGTGARNGYGWAGPFHMGAPTGMIVRYRVASESEVWNAAGLVGAAWGSWNALDIVFSWNF